MKRRSFFKTGLSIGAIALIEPVKSAQVLASSFEGKTTGPIILSTCNPHLVVSKKGTGIFPSNM